MRMTYRIHDQPFILALSLKFTDRPIRTRAHGCMNIEQQTRAPRTMDNRAALSHTVLFMHVHWNLQSLRSVISKVVLGTKVVNDTLKISTSTHLDGS